MALVVVRVFSDLQEAQVAASALRAAGLHPSIPDSQVGSTYWILQQGIGGLRLCVPEDEADDASTIFAEALSQANAQADETAPQAPPLTADRLWPVRAAGALGLGMFGSMAGGWLVVRRRGLAGNLWTGAGVLLLAGMLIAVYRAISAHASGY